MRTYNRFQLTKKICMEKIKDLCRLCMNTDTSMYDIFTVSEKNQDLSLSSKILKCLSIEVKNNSELPNRLCACCLKSLNDFTDFWELCHQTDKRLHHIIESSYKSSPTEGKFKEAPCYSGYDELYKSPEDPRLFSTDDEEPLICESPPHFPLLSSDISGNTVLVDSNARLKSSCDLSEEEPCFVPSEISLFENDIDDETSKFKLQEVADISEGDNGVEVQVSMNGNSYIVEVLEQSNDKDSIATTDEIEDAIEKCSQNLEVQAVSCNQSSYQCPTCKDLFDSSSDLITHVKAHGDEKVSMCKSCLKWFSSRGALLRHERIHSGERPYKCDHCSRSFTQKEILRRHFLTHSGDKPYKCDSCNKSYTQKEALRMHFKNNHVPRKLVEILQYKCNLCTKSFCHPSGLSRHQQFHAGIKYPCKSCDRIFTDQSCLRRHNQRVHLSGNNSQANVNKRSNNTSKLK